MSFKYQIDHHQFVTRIPHDTNIVGASDVASSTLLNGAGATTPVNTNIEVIPAEGNQGDFNITIHFTTAYTPLVDNMYEVSVTVDFSGVSFQGKWRKNKGAYTTFSSAGTYAVADGIVITWPADVSWKKGDTWFIKGNFGRPQILAMTDANTVFVSRSGSDAGGAGAGGTFAAPKLTIEGARIRAAALGFTQIGIKDSGTYPESIGTFTTAISIESLRGFKPIVESSFSGLNGLATAANSLYVAKSIGANIDGNGSEKNPFASISFALANWRPGIGFIVISDGEDYTGEGVLDLTVVKSNVDAVTLSLTSKYYPKVRGVTLVSYNTQNPTISGIHFQGTSIGNGIGIEIIYLTGVTSFPNGVRFIARYNKFSNLGRGLYGASDTIDTQTGFCDNGTTLQAIVQVEYNVFYSVFEPIYFGSAPLSGGALFQWRTDNSITISNNYFYRCGIVGGTVGSAIHLKITRTGGAAVIALGTLLNNTIHDCSNFNGVLVDMDKVGGGIATITITIQNFIFKNVRNAILGNQTTNPANILSTMTYTSNNFFNVNVFFSGFDAHVDGLNNTLNTTDPLLFEYSPLPKSSTAVYNAGTGGLDKGVDAQQFSIFRSLNDATQISLYGLTIKQNIEFPFVHGVRSNIVDSRFVKMESMECGIIALSTVTNSILQNNEIKNCNIGINANLVSTTGGAVRGSSLVWNDSLGISGYFINAGGANAPLTGLTIYGYKRGFETIASTLPIIESILQNNTIDISILNAITIAVTKTRYLTAELLNSLAVITNANNSNLEVDFIDTVNGDFRLRSKFSGHEIESELIYYSDVTVNYNGVIHFADIGAYLIARTAMQDRWISITLNEPFDGPEHIQTPAEGANNVNRNGNNRVMSRGRKEVIEFLWDTMAAGVKDNILSIFKDEYQKENSGKIRIYFNYPADKSFLNFKVDLSLDVRYNKRVNHRALTFHDGIGIAVREYDK